MMYTYLYIYIYIRLVVKILAPELGHITAIPCGPPYGYHVGLPYLHLAKSKINLLYVAGAVARTFLLASHYQCCHCCH